MKRPALLGLVVSLVLTAPVRAQMPHDMPIVVQADKILIGAEFVPRCTAMPQALIVPAGQTVTAPTSGTFDCIEVEGMLKVSRTADTVLKFTHFMILPGGVLDVGTVADPIPVGRRVEFIVRDVPLDTTKDPFQWGNGLLNFGRQTRVGAAKTPFVETAGTLDAGATSITLGSAPIGWQVGDELLIPDTATPQFDMPSRTGTPRREGRVTVTAINGAVVTLSKGLDFAHFPITDPQGVIVLRPRVANLTRNIVLRSENPNGSRGHTADLGHGSIWDIRFNQSIGLGRTQNVPLEDTVLATGHIGTNQRGKYAEHHHHNESAPLGVDFGNTYQGVGAPVSKWALAIHGTSDTLVEQNIVVDFPGAGISTEDGNEVRNVFRKNFVAYILGNIQEFQQEFDAKQEVDRNCPGCDGAGYWFRGVQNVFDSNEAWNTFGNGIDLFNQQFPPGIKYPSEVGGMPDTVPDHFQTVPISFTNNITAANVVTGLELWGMKSYPLDRLITVNNLMRGVYAPSSDGTALALKNPLVVCAAPMLIPERPTVGIDSNNGYVGSFDLVGGNIAGCGVGLQHGGSLAGANITGTTIQATVGIDTTQRHLLLDNVMFKTLNGAPPQFVVIGSNGLGTDHGKVWDGVSPLPVVGLNMFTKQQGSDLVVKNWQGTGKDYRFFYKQSVATLPAWYSAYGQHAYNPPVKGLTFQQTWDQFGMGYGGDILQTADAKELEGLVYGLAREGLNAPLGPPRAIFTFPTLRESAVLEGDFHDVVYTYVLFTGDGSTASRVLMASVDGGPAFTAGDANEFDNRGFGIQNQGPTCAVGGCLSPGVHTVKVWRTRKDDPAVAIPGSEHTGQYVVGQPPPCTTCDCNPALCPPPPTDVCPNIDGIQPTVPPGMQLVGGQCVPIPPPPVDVCPNLDGVQETVPPGFQLVGGKCVPVTPPPAAQKLCLVEGTVIISCTPLVKQ